MANAVYPLWKQTVIQAGANSSLAGSGTTGTYCSLVNTADHSYSSSDQYFSAFSGTLAPSVSSIVATITSGTESSLPSATAKSTYTAGAANPSISNAPPLPDGGCIWGDEWRD